MNAIEFEHVPCNFCNHTGFETIYNTEDNIYKAVPGTFPIVRCTKCGLVYERIRPTFETIHFAYPEFYTTDMLKSSRTGLIRQKLEHFAYSTIMKRRIKILSKRVKLEQTSKVLDIGCSHGDFLEALYRTRNCKVYGLEISQKDIDFIKAERPYISICNEDIMHIRSLPEKSFDLITLYHVLEHLHDPKKVLEKVNTLLNTGGKLIISTQNFNSLSRRLLRKRWPLNDSPRHLYHFTLRTLTMYLEAAGFTVLKKHFYSDSFPSLGIMLTANYLTNNKNKGSLVTLLLTVLLLPLDILSIAFHGTCNFSVVAKKIQEKNTEVKAGLH